MAKLRLDQIQTGFACTASAIVRGSGGSVRHRSAGHARTTAIDATFGTAQFGMQGDDNNGLFRLANAYDDMREHAAMQGRSALCLCQVHRKVGDDWFVLAQVTFLKCRACRKQLGMHAI